jgi:ferredoxin
MKKVIQKNKISDLLKTLSKFDVYGPIEEDGVILYRKLEKNKPLLDFTNSQKPPKQVFFRQTEKMLDFEKEGNRFIGAKTSEGSDKSIILFGVRPCDASSFTVLDKLFSWDYIDPYYVNRRNNSIVISFGCTNPGMPLKNCFCTSVGGSPCSTDGADMLWTDIGDSYFVESLSDKGNKIVQLGGKLFKDPTVNQQKTVKELYKTAEKSITRNVDLKNIPSKLEASFDSDYWEQFSKRCLGCGICTLLCPTCHCFDINDIVSKGKGWRERTWDSCQYPYYTIHASGHNPRPVKKHRQRNRMYHKFLYMNKNLDVLGCVGCGRCISKCPVNIDIIEVAEGIMEVA